MYVGALQVFGIVLSLGMGYMQTAFNPQAGVNIANWFLCGLLLAGYVLLATHFCKDDTGFLCCPYSIDV